MIDEELENEAEEYALGMMGNKYDEFCKLEQTYIDAYKKGCAEGRKERWHDLRKNPNDLPPRINRFSETVISQIGTPCRYSFEKSCWQNWSYIDIETPIAWCELPRYEE